MDSRTMYRERSSRNFTTAFLLLNRLKDKLGLTPSVVEKTAYTYRKVQEAGLIRGRTINAVLVACLYITCRELGVSRTIDELAETSNLRKKSIAKIYREIVFHLERKIPQVNCFQCIDKIANKIELSERTIRHARDLMKKVLIKNFLRKGDFRCTCRTRYLCITSLDRKQYGNYMQSRRVPEVTLEIGQRI